GPAGVFYRQFAFTLAIAILISAVNALTLSPALCALFLKNEHAGEGEHGRKKGFMGRFYAGFNAGFNGMTDRYIRSLKFLVRRKWVAVAALVLITAGAFYMAKKTPTGFIPTEDQGFVLFAVNTPPGSSLERTHQATLQIDSIIKQDPAYSHLYVIDGLNFLSNANASPYAAGFMRLKDYD